MIPSVNDKEIDVGDHVTQIISVKQPDTAYSTTKRFNTNGLSRPNPFAREAIENMHGNRHLTILGIRGLPAQHGGFETFAEKLSLHLIKQGWSVTVYCQEESGGDIWESDWQGVHRIHIPVGSDGAKASVLFDLKAAIHAKRNDSLLLTLGYNTACFHLIQRWRGQTNVINMDGIEWKRQKWGAVAKIWFWLNERAGCYLGNHLIADHPDIKRHLATRVSEEKLTMIPYGGEEIKSANEENLVKYGLEPRKFSVVIARPEPENSILEIVKAFSNSKRNHKLVVLGSFKPDDNEYHREVLGAASEDVLFPGAIYDKDEIAALRLFSKFYIHGHQVGGTNPSLVEAMGAGSAVIAHDNKYNHWVAGSGAMYFKNTVDCLEIFDRVLEPNYPTESHSKQINQRFYERLTWQQILAEYETLLSSWHPVITEKAEPGSR